MTPKIKSPAGIAPLLALTLRPYPPLSSGNLPPEGRNLLETIIARIKKAEGVTSDTDVAKALLMDRRNLASRKKEGSVPYSRLIQYSRTRGVSLEFLLNGTGPIRREAVELGTAEPGAIYHVTTDQDALYDVAASVYRALQELDTTVPPEKFARIVRLLHRNMLERHDTAVSYAHVLEVVKLAL